MPKPKVTRRALLGSAAGAVFAKAFPAASSPLTKPLGGARKRNTKIIPYKTWYTRGSYGAWANNWALWNPTPLRLGKDYNAQWIIDLNTFPNNSNCVWYLPYGPIPSGAGVWGYYFLGYGNYDWSEQQVPVNPLEVCNLTEFSTTFDFTYKGDDEFNLLHELFLTREPIISGGVSENELLEVGFFLHPAPSTIAYHKYGTYLGTHTNNGITYTVTVNYGSTLPDAYYVTFLAQDHLDHTVGSVDWEAALNYLLSISLITGSEWINGIGFGIEVAAKNGAGTRRGNLDVKSYGVTFTGSTAAPSADYLGTNLLPDGNGFSSWRADALTANPGQRDADGSTGAFFLAETTANAVHYYTPASSPITVPSAQGDYIWFEDINTVGRDMVVFILADGSFANQLTYRWRKSSNRFYNSGPNIGTGLTTIQSENIPARGYGLTMVGIKIGGTGGFYRVFWRFRKAVGITTLNLRIGTCLGNVSDETVSDYTFSGDPEKGIIVRPRHRLIHVA